MLTKCKHFYNNYIFYILLFYISSTASFNFWIFLCT
nr:MAG TPA: hypothetical protein [Caudoviricetes sp.]